MIPVGLIVNKITELFGGGESGSKQRAKTLLQTDEKVLFYRVPLLKYLQIYETHLKMVKKIYVWIFRTFCWTLKVNYLYSTLTPILLILIMTFVEASAFRNHQAIQCTGTDRSLQIEYFENFNII